MEDIKDTDGDLYTRCLDWENQYYENNYIT